MASGTVEWFTDASEYDFVVSDEIGGDLCARGSNVDAAMGTRLTEGDRAEFQARVGAWRPGMDGRQANADGIAALGFEQTTERALRGFGNLDHGAILRFER